MPKVPFTEALRGEYDTLFNTCVIATKHAAEVEKLVDGLVDSRPRYEAVSLSLGGSPPWFFIAVVHNMEASQSFKGHLHNGDPLTARTKHVPAGRPVGGTPPFTWEESAEDALRQKRLDAWSDWTVPGMLYKTEEYNGWGYRLHHSHVLSPYLWSYSNHYTSGKYVADGTWSDSAVSKQCGGAVLLRRMAELGIVSFPLSPAAPTTPAIPTVRYAPNKVVAEAIELQKFLNTIPGIFVKVDGRAGKKTSDAFRKVFGTFLPGDPRAS